MNKKIAAGLVLVLLFAGVTTQAQELWSLERCVTYAIDNNIRIKQQALNVNYQENLLKQSKYDMIPSLNGNLGQNFAFGRSLTQLNTYTNKNSQTTDASLNSDVTLFNGLAKKNTITKRDFELKAALQSLEKTKDDISLAVVSAYLEILFNKELVAVTTDQIVVTKQQIDYNTKQVEAGNMAQGKLLETESQLANEELTLTNYENQLQLSILNLIQLLELKESAGFDIVIPTFDVSVLNAELITIDSVFAKAVIERPEILSKEFALQSMENENKVARAMLYPSLGAGFSWYNNYNNQYEYIDGSGKIPFSEQIQNNGRTQVYLTLRIPIFNGLQARTNLNNSLINFENSKFELQQEKNNLLKEIQQVHLNAVAAMKKYYSSEKAVQSSQEAFRYIEEKFNLGIVTPLEYNDSKNQVTNAQSSFIQAKYEYIFRIKILDFYNGKPITL